MLEFRTEGGKVHFSLDGEPLELIADLSIIVNAAAKAILEDSASPADAVQNETMMLASTRAAIRNAFEAYQAEQAAKAQGEN